MKKEMRLITIIFCYEKCIFFHHFQLLYGKFLLEWTVLMIFSAFAFFLVDENVVMEAISTIQGVHRIMGIIRIMGN